MILRPHLAACLALAVAGCSRDASPDPAGLDVQPPAVTLAPHGSQAFAAVVTGAVDPSVAWSVQEASGGTITAAGLYTAPATQGTWHVVATSVADPTKRDTATVSVAAPGGTPGAWVSAYYPGYQRDDYPPAEVDFSAITHLFVGAALPRADGTLDTSFYLDPTSGPALAKDLSARAHAAGRKAILMIGGDGAIDGFRGAVSSANRARFVATLLSAMRDLGYDGLDLDWEPFTDADKPILLALMRDLRTAAPAAILAMPIGWVGAYSGADPWYATAAPYLDQLNIMSYGMADAWPGWKSWHHAALFGEGGDHPSSVSSSALAYADAGVPKAKIGIGIGFYGSCWTGVTGPLQSIPGSGGVVASDNTMSYAHVMASYWSAAAYSWDGVAKSGSLSFAQPHGPEGCTWVSYEDAPSIAAKGQWVLANGFGGTILWTVNQGYVASTRTNPPLEAVKQAFLP